MPRISSRNTHAAGAARALARQQDQFDEFLAQVGAEITPAQARHILDRYKLTADRRGWLAPAPSCLIEPSN